MVNSAAEAEAAVRACRYPPDGGRSYGPVAAGLRTENYAATANQAITCIAMIETVAAIEALDEILAVRGVDAIYVGPADLSISLGLPPVGDDENPRFVEALEAILAGCVKHGIPVGIHASPALTERYLQMGFQMITATSDLDALRDGLADAMALIRPGSPAAGDSIY